MHKINSTRGLQKLIVAPPSGILATKGEGGLIHQKKISVSEIEKKNRKHKIVT